MKRAQTLRRRGSGGTGDPVRVGGVPLYVEVAAAVEQQIRIGALQPGDRAPSVRGIKRDWRVSTSTALQCLSWLEKKDLVEAKPRSGFFVRTPNSERVPEPSTQDHPGARQVPGLDVVLGQLLRQPRGWAQLGGAVPAEDCFPVRQLNRMTREVLRQTPHHSCGYAFPPGEPDLRRQIARYAAARGLADCTPDQITVTSGAMDGLTLALRAVARPGDTIAVESPTYFGIHRMIRALGMRALPIPTHPRRGIDIDALERSVRVKGVRACIIISNCHNPLGFILSDETKRALAQLARRRRLAIIEDDIFGDLAFRDPRPTTIRSHDRDGRILLVSSFSKVLGPGYRVGWVAGGRWQARIEQLQFVNTVAAPSLPQHVLARFLASGAYDRHLRRVRLLLGDRLERLTGAVTRHFPKGTRMTRPEGGFLLWVQMPESVDAIALYHQALKREITITPGPLFSPDSRFASCMRLSYGMPWSEELNASIVTLGSLAKAL